MIYFIGNIEQKIVKIGYTTDVESRLQSIQTGSAYKLTIFKVIDGEISDEKELHEKYLNIRSFTDRQKREGFERQKKVCVKCGNTFKIEEMEADHIIPWSEGGQTISSNCQLLCKNCNRTKSNK